MDKVGQAQQESLLSFDCTLRTEFLAAETGNAVIQIDAHPL